MRLIICGNGFDLHHHLATSYSSYKEYLEKNHRRDFKAYESLAKLGGCKDCWSDIEAALARVNFHTIIEKTTRNSVVQKIHEYEQGNSDELSTFAMQMAMATGFVSNFTGKYFFDWLSNVDVSTVNRDKGLRFSKDDIFVTFNYTDTLEELYGVPERRILHIHGSLSDINEDTAYSDILEAYDDSFLGFDDNQHDHDQLDDYQLDNEFSFSIHEAIRFGGIIDVDNRIESLERAYITDETSEAFFRPILDLIRNYYRRSAKEIEDKKEELRVFLRPYAKNSIDTVRIMGHSLVSVDDSYYEDVIVPLTQNAKWEFMVHGKDRSEIDQFIDKYGLSDTVLINW